MKRKYYMRGLGTGIVVTALLCAFTFPKHKTAEMTDAEIIARAQELGYKKEGGVTAEDINKLKENEQLTKMPSLTPEATPEATPEPTTEPPEQPTPPKQPTPVTEDGKLTPEPVKTSTPQPTKTPTPEPTKTPTPEPTKTPTPQPTKTPTPEPTKAPTETPTPEPTKAPTETPSNPPTKAPGTSYTIRVERGMTATQVAGALKSAGAITDAEDFVAYLRREKLTDFINIGTFTIPQGAGYAEIAGILTR